MDYQRIASADIVIGQPLPWDVYDGNKRLLLSKGAVVEWPQQIAVLIERGLFVAAGSGAVPRRQAAGVSERPSALRLINRVNQRLQPLLYRFGTEPDTEARIRELAADLAAAADLNADVALACILLN